MASRFPANTGGLPASGGGVVNPRLIKSLSRSVLVAACGVGVAGCGRQSIVSPHSPQAADIRTLWWWMLGVATLVFGGAVVILALSWFRRATPGLPLLRRW